MFKEALKARTLEAILKFRSKLNFITKIYD